MNRSRQNQNTTRVILTDPVEAGDHHCIVFIVLAVIKSNLLAKYEITVFVDPPLPKFNISFNKFSQNHVEIITKKVLNIEYL